MRVHLVTALIVMEARAARIIHVLVQTISQNLVVATETLGKIFMVEKLKMQTIILAILIFKYLIHIISVKILSSAFSISLP